MGTNISGSAADIITLGYRVLVVDDYQPFQEMLAASLGRLAQIKEIDYADNGIGAIEKAEAKQYDLIFLDVMMPPGIDGYETCSRLRANPGYNKTPIIMVSGMGSPFDEAKGIISGCTTYVTKPIQHEPFLELCKIILKTINLS
jgi:two-component system cell cycle response regulator